MIGTLYKRFWRMARVKHENCELVSSKKLLLVDSHQSNWLRNDNGWGSFWIKREVFIEHKYLFREKNYRNLTCYPRHTPPTAVRRATGIPLFGWWKLVVVVTSSQVSWSALSKSLIIWNGLFITFFRLDRSEASILAITGEP